MLSKYKYLFLEHLNYNRCWLLYLKKKIWNEKKKKRVCVFVRFSSFFFIFKFYFISVKIIINKFFIDFYFSMCRLLAAATASSYICDLSIKKKMFFFFEYYIEFHSSHTLIIIRVYIGYLNDEAESWLRSIFNFELFMNFSAQKKNETRNFLLL